MPPERSLTHVNLVPIPTPETTLLEFPCEVDVKVMGVADEAFHATTRAAVEKHAGPLPEHCIRVRPSSGGRYVSITYVVAVNSHAHLQAVYTELHATGVVLFKL
jgi:putative lipoic acid-binding regulatory protein